MCYSISARPPAPPISGGAADIQDVVLTSSDTTDFAAFAAHPEVQSKTGIVVLPDVRGLFGFYEDLAVRFAESGIHAVAIDYFGRTAGVGKRGDDFDWQSHVGRTTQDGIAKDVRAAVEFLRSEPGGSCSNVFSVGFCFGGSNSWNQAAEGHGLSGAIGFYGRPGPGLVDGAPGPLTKIGQFECPILALQAGADDWIPEAEVHEFEQQMNAKGIPNEVVIYPGTTHSFFDRAYAQFKPECDDAWLRVLNFVRKYQN